MVKQQAMGRRRLLLGRAVVPVMVTMYGDFSYRGLKTGDLKLTCSLDSSPTSGLAHKT
jgi:hypothetical protein